MTSPSKNESIITFSFFETSNDQPQIQSMTSPLYCYVPYLIGLKMAGPLLVRYSGTGSCDCGLHRVVGTVGLG